MHAGLVIDDLMRHYAGDDRLDWLISDSGAKWSLLTELSRLQQARGDDALWEAADWLLENKPRVRPAMTVLRLFRRGKAPESTTDGLYHALERAIDNYQATHLKLTPAEVERTIMSLLSAKRSRADS